jgi:hypothetical protein
MKNVNFEIFWEQFAKAIIIIIIIIIFHKKQMSFQRLGWSRGRVLAFRTQVSGFKTGRSRRIFQGEKNPQHTFLQRGSKAVGPMS